VKRPFQATPEDFSISPLLTILPKKGNTGNLSLFTSSLYARFEKVRELREEISDSEDKNSIKKVLAEEAMLKQVLEWLEVNI